jgi:flagellar hook-associated protein 3 FlgL
MRITFASQYRDAMLDVEQASERLADYQRQVSSGRRIDRPSDDPAAITSIAAEHNRTAELDQYQRTGDSAYSRLTVIDTVLSDVLVKLTAAQTSALSAAGVTASAEQRTAAAQQLAGIKASLLDNFNASFQGNYLFAGARSTTKPYTAGAGGVVGAYAGSTTEVAVDIEQSRSITIGFDGSSIVQGSDPADVFATIDSLIAAVNAADSAGIDAGMVALDRMFKRVTAAQSRVGMQMETLDSERTRLGTVKVASATRLSRLQDANMAEAISGMTQAETAYKAALAATATASKVSLMDYL